MRRAFLLLSLCLSAVGAAYADSGIAVDFPNNAAYSCGAGAGCGLLGANGGLSMPLFTTGDFVEETFVTREPSVDGLSAHFGVVDFFGGNPGAEYENDLYINGVLVGVFLLDDCNYCGTLLTVGGTVNFAPIFGSGTYDLRIVLAQSAAPGQGSERFSATDSGGGPSIAVLSPTPIPEPGSLALFGSGLVGLIKILRRRKPTG